ncbi:indole-3-glycerol phosphate synthase TrpC [Alicyclobacillus tolerans]|uniref:Indole-3-glycerol phosphate synthase n=1 Tax=Alicyclobacillus tolerans TaxID=90970 RepID=A0A1M6MQI3_9BACL|nr:indole-3-glycerol phosphate synthase TrpC [Alicyclobacillus montanus]SHJ85610.1 indole-3-glycerol phosphate synthase [Alicyclobacillus montanus]
MSSFLEEILRVKEQEVTALPDRPTFERNITLKPSLRKRLLESDHLQIVAEFKRASPSKGIIVDTLLPVERAKRYEDAGAAAVSVLTDQTFFRGSLQDLREIAESVQIPVLRKDFIISEKQLREAHAAGADIVLLIVAALSSERLAELRHFAAELGLETLIEIHNERELETALAVEPDILGINNRNLHTFEVSLQTTEQLMTQIPSSIPVLSESGMATPDDAQRVAIAGVSGLLIGETLMRQGDDQLPGVLRGFQVKRFPLVKGSY